MRAVAAVSLVLVFMSPEVSHGADCPSSYVCASNPQSVVASMQVQGYKALLATDKQGDPKIESAANGYDFTVFFYGCTEAKECRSLGFSAGFEKEAAYTLAFVNKWNHEKRFSQMSIEDDGGMRLTYDVSTEGGLNQVNFADVVDWWQAMLVETNRFYNENKLTVPSAAAAK